MAGTSSLVSCSSSQPNEEWRASKAAILKLENLLRCSLCQEILKDPHNLSSCEHYYCKECIYDWLGTKSSVCPECSLPSWVKDIKPNHQLAGVITNLLQLRDLVTTTHPTLSQEKHSSQSSEAADIWEKAAGGSRSLSSTSAVMPTRLIATSSTDVDCFQGNSNRPRLLPQQSSCCGLAAAHTPPSIHLEKAPHNIQRRISLGGRKRLSSLLTADEGSSKKPLPAKRQQLVRSSYPPTAASSSLLSAFPFTPLVTKTRSFQKLDSAAKVQRLNSNIISIKRPPQPSSSNSSSCTRASSTSSNTRDSSSKHMRQVGLDTFIKPSLPPSSRPLPSRPQPSRCSEGKENHPVAPPTPSVLLGHTMRRNIRGETPLHMAAIKGDDSAVKALLAQGADLNIKDHAGWTPLHEACNHGHYSVVELLLGAGAIVNIPGYENVTPLHDAVVNEQEHIVTLLLSHGASVNTRNRYGYTPCDLAMTDSMKTALSSCPAPSPSISSQSTVQSPVLIKTVLLGSGLSRAQKVRLKELATIIRADLTTEFTSNVTHVVTGCDKDGCCLRTMKCLSAIAGGKWLLNYTWVTQCLKERSKVDEEAHEVKGVCVNGGQHLSEGAKRGRYNTLMKSPGLFDGCEFFFYGSFPPHPSKADIQYLVTLAGGRILSREPKSDHVDSHVATSCYPFHAELESVFTSHNQLIVYDPQHHSPAAMSTRKEAIIVPASWILDCICAFKLLDIP